jgi:hypothetical protein
MNARISDLEALRVKANVQGKADAIEQFRADFKAVWSHWRTSGQMTQDERAAGYAEASRAVQANLHDAAWMRGAAEHFAEMADTIRHDTERSERIRAEMAAAREAA